MKKAIRYLFTFTVFLSAIGIYFTNRLMYIKKKDDELIFNRERQSGRLDPLRYENLPKTDILISSPFGYQIKAVVVEPYDTNRYVIIAHGVTENKTNSIKYLNLFLQRGFNGIIYDHRRHGETGGKTTSFGHFEKYDLKAVVDWIKNNKGHELILGIHGESMGAATVILYAGMLEDGADFYIVDCPFSDFKDQLRHILKTDMKLPPKLVLPIAQLFLRIREKYLLRDVSPISVIENIKNPILFIHSQEDDYILPTMTDALFKRKKGPKKLFLAEKGGHAQAFNENKTAYEKAIDEFLEEYVE